MSDTLPFASDILLVAAAGLAVILAQWVGALTRVPFSSLVLALTAIVAAAVPGFHRPSATTVERVVTVALVAVLFAGGMGMGGRRFVSAAGPILALGLAGTFATAGLLAAFIHYAFNLAWYPALLVATAVSPTDPTVVFSVLGRRPVPGRSGAILEGESGANDPVGIALMAGLIGGKGITGSGLSQAAWSFFQQMSVGAVIGLAGGCGLLWLMRHAPLPGSGLDPIRTLVAAFLIYGLASLAHGSGFLAVFVAGIVIGDHDVAGKAEIEHFHDALGSLGEMAAFVALGLTVHLQVVGRLDVWAPGLAVGAVTAFAVRPVVARVCLLGAHLSAPERRFIEFAGLKGAVPILLGTFLLTTGLADTTRLYGIVVVVVVFSVVVQGGLIGPAISVLHLDAVPADRSKDRPRRGGPGKPSRRWPSR